MATKYNKSEYEQQAINEIKRVDKLFTGTLTFDQYNSKASKGLSLQVIQHRLGWKFNDLKEKAGIKLNVSRGYKKEKPVVAKGKTVKCPKCGDDFQRGVTWQVCPSCFFSRNSKASVSDFEPGSDRFNIGYM